MCTIGELSPHVEDSDNDNVPIISSPIRLTPEPDEVSQRKVVRTRRDVRGRRSHNDNEVRLSVKERLYISKKDIGMWTHSLHWTAVCN